MNNDLVDRWNTVVRSQDTVYVVGDICMGRLDDTLPYIQFLNGRKLLVPGNHDRMFGCQGTKYRNVCDRYEAAGIEVIEEALVLNVFGLSVLICHFPYAGDSRDDQIEDRYQEDRPIDVGQFLVHGHTHGKWRKNGRMIDVGVDAWAGKPVSFTEVADTFRWPQYDMSPLLWVRP